MEVRNAKFLQSGAHGKGSKVQKCPLCPTRSGVPNVRGFRGVPTVPTVRRVPSVRTVHSGFSKISGFQRAKPAPYFSMKAPMIQYRMYETTGRGEHRKDLSK